MKRYAFRSVLGVAVVVGALCATGRAQDLTTQLSLFLVDLRAGTFGATQTFTSISFRSGTAGTINGPTGANFNLLAASGQSTRIGNADGVPLVVGGTSIQVPATGGFSQYRNVNTAGWGVPGIYAAGRATAQAAANASVATYTVGAADGSFEVSANVLVTTATTHTFTVECAYTDEGNTARTVTFSFEQLAGTLTTSITNTNGAVPYEGVPMHIRAKAATAILIRTQAAGVYTAVVYNVEGIIKQTA